MLLHAVAKKLCCDTCACMAVPSTIPLLLPPPEREVSNAYKFSVSMGLTGMLVLLLPLRNVGIFTA
eukprot:gene15478-17699_t